MQKMSHNKSHLMVYITTYFVTPQKIHLTITIQILPISIQTWIFSKYFYYKIMAYRNTNINNIRFKTTS